MNLTSTLIDWDGKQVSVLEGIYKTESGKSDFIDKLVSLLENDSEKQIAVTWLIKKYLEEGHSLSAKVITAIFKHLPKLERWESRLHICQSLQYLNFPKTSKKKLEAFLRNCLADDNKFVRVWAYSGFYELAVAFPEYQKEVRQFFEMAMRDEAPSVKSRIRNVMKKGF